ERDVSAAARRRRPEPARVSWRTSSRRSGSSAASDPRRLPALAAVHQQDRAHNEGPFRRRLTERPVLGPSRSLHLLTGRPALTLVLATAPFATAANRFLTAF